MAVSGHSHTRGTSLAEGRQSQLGMSWRGCDVLLTRTPLPLSAINENIKQGPIIWLNWSKWETGDDHLSRDQAQCPLELSVSY